MRTGRTELRPRSSCSGSRSGAGREQRSQVDSASPVGRPPSSGASTPHQSRSRPTPRVLGVDDWAGRRGRTYGTLLVDLERRRAVDLLPDREMATPAAWLTAHPGVELIARDRAGAYAEAARLAAPDAIQVADRFHLLRNLSEALERVMTRYHVLVRSVAAECGEPDPLPRSAVRKRAYSGLPGNQAGLTGPERRSTERRARRLARYEEVVARRQQGVPKRTIARLLTLNRRTVATWLASGAFPERRPRTVPVPTALARFAAYAVQRYDAGLDNARALERELRPLGYTGSYAAVGRYLHRLRRTRPRGGGNAPALPDLRRPAVTAREAVWAIQTPDAELSASAQVFIHKLSERSSALATTRTLALAYRGMFRDHDANALRPWLAAARHSELRRLAIGLERDVDAVLAGIVFPWSTGQVEGHVHRLKLVKRAMYGRASFELLRARVLHAA